MTITVKADAGYALDSLTVTDARGNAVQLTDKGNGIYTFTMPASKVSVKAAFTKTGSTSAFLDVPAGSYFEAAVRWALENGITTGTSASTFSPDAACTRAEIVTFLWRAAA